MKYLIFGSYEYPYSYSIYAIIDGKEKSIFCNDSLITRRNYQLFDDLYTLVCENYPYYHYKDKEKTIKLKEELFKKYDVILRCDDGSVTILKGE